MEPINAQNQSRSFQMEKLQQQARTEARKDNRQLDRADITELFSNANKNNFHVQLPIFMRFVNSMKLEIFVLLFLKFF